MIDSRLKNYYNDIVVFLFKNRFNIVNKFSTPKLKKICINIGTKNVVKDFKIMELIYKNLMLITGQKCFFTKSKKSISSFKLRKSIYIGCKITLRKVLMYEFLDRLINIALPQVKDFKGFSDTQFNDQLNFSLGIKEYIVFPEINYLESDKVSGMDITIVISSTTKEEAKFLLKNFNFPFLY